MTLTELAEELKKDGYRVRLMYAKTKWYEKKEPIQLIASKKRKQKDSSNKIKCGRKKKQNI